MSTAADQLKRLLTLIPRLADGESHPVADVATIVGISPEELIDDLRSLVDRFDTPGGFVDAIRIYQDGDKVSVVGQHFLRPMRLTMAELCALELGLAIIRSERPESELAPIDRAIERLRNVIARVPGDDRAEGTTAGSLDAAGVSKDHLAALRRAVRERHKATILYRRSSAPDPERRTICPYCLVFSSGMWYVVAHCEKAEALRVFRLDRVIDAKSSGDAYAVPADFSVDRVLEGSRALLADQTDETLRVRYSPRIAKWIAEREGRELESDGSVIVEHPLLDDEWAVRHVLQYGPEAQVLKPARVRSQVVERLR